MHLGRHFFYYFFCATVLFFHPQYQSIFLTQRESKSICKTQSLSTYLPTYTLTLSYQKAQVLLSKPAWFRLLHLNSPHHTNPPLFGSPTTVDHLSTSHLYWYRYSLPLPTFPLQQNLYRYANSQPKPTFKVVRPRHHFRKLRKYSYRYMYKYSVTCIVSWNAARFSFYRFSQSNPFRM